MGMDFPGGSNGKECTCNVGDLGSIPGLGRSPRGGHVNSLLNLAWRIPWTEEAGGLQSMGSQRVAHDRATKHTDTEALNAFEEFLSLSLILNKSSMKTGILALFMGVAQVPGSVSLC